MVKTKLSKKPKASSSQAQKPKPQGSHMRQKGAETERILRDDVSLKEYDPIKNLLDTSKMGAAIMECLIENDTDGALEIIEGYLYAVNRTQFLKDAKVPRSTVYNFCRRKNPTIKTLAKIMYASAHAGD